MENKFKMVMLPSEKVNGIIKCNTTQQLLVEYGENYNEEGWKAQSLYIIDTQATIEIGDWYINPNDKRPTSLEDMPWVCQDAFHAQNLQGLDCYKVIEATNPELNLPTIPEQLVKEYVDQQFKYVPDKYICRKCGGLAIDSKALMNYHHIDKSYIKGEVEFETKLEDCLKCMDCGNSWMNGKEKSTRELALKWWNSYGWKRRRTDEVFGYMKRTHNSLTGREIEQIWELEVTDKFFSKETQPKVDFEMLKKTIERLPHDMSNHLMMNDEYINNFVLFFQMLKKSSSFAHKAHKSLKD